MSYLDDTVKDYATQATAAYATPIKTGTFTGRQFVAGEDPLQTQAIGMAQQGVGSYQPYLTAAQAAQQQSIGQLGAASGAVGGLGALTGPMTTQQQQDYMSPYQTQVIDETLRQYDLSRQGGVQNIKDQAVAAGGFGGGREGAMLGQYQGDTLANRAGLRAGMLQQGLQNAQGRFDQNFSNQQQIANMRSGLSNAYGNQAGAQMGLGNYQRAGMGQDISALGSMGAMRQGLSQAQLGADQQMHQTAAYEPFGRLQDYGNVLTGLQGGVAGQQYQQPGQSNPWQTAMGTALGLGGLYGKIFG
jgi:hypothetical protein|tara:strand:+ start:106 stop:1008 length:903 start_codon:yes stop_codon:yes gene_type:complete